VCAAGGVVVTVDPEPLVGAEVEPVGPDATRVCPGRDEDPLSREPRSPEHDATVIRTIAMPASTNST